MKFEEKEIESGYGDRSFVVNGKLVKFTTQITGKFKISGNDITGKVVKRYWTLQNGNDWSFGTPSQVVRLLNKNGITTYTNEDLKHDEQNWIEGQIEKIKEDLVRQRKEKFMQGLKELLKENGFKLKVESECGGWGESWSETTISLKDDVFLLEEYIAYLHDNDNITIGE